MTDRRAVIYGSDHGVTPDEKDDQLLAQRVEHWERFKGPRVGDYIEFADGVTHRFSHDHGKEWGIQTSPIGGSFYMTVGGYMSYSGGLEPCLKHNLIYEIGEQRMGGVWFFHHDHARASNAVKANIPCRVFKTSANSDHWKPTAAQNANQQLDVPELVEGLEASGLKVEVIDEHTDFSKLLGQREVD